MHGPSHLPSGATAAYGNCWDFLHRGIIVLLFIFRFFLVYDYSTIYEYVLCRIVHM